MKKIIIGLMALSLFGLGCERYLDSSTPTQPAPTELTAPIDVSATINDRSISISWDHVAPATVAQFRLYISDSLAGDYALRDSTTAYNYSFDNLIQNRAYYFEIAAVGSDGIEGLRATPIRALTGPISIVIANGDNITNSRQVQVQLNSVSQTTHVIISEDSLFAGAVYESFSQNKSFELSAGEGEKMVYARFLFADGAETGELLTDWITLDLKAEIESVSFAPAGPFVSFDSVIFTVDATEIGGTASVSIEGAGSVTLYDDGQSPDNLADDGIYAGLFLIDAELVLTEAGVSGSFTDEAGNSATLVSRQLMNVTSSLTAVQLIEVAAQSSSEILINWTESTSPDFATYRLFRAVAPGVDNSSELIKTISSAGSRSYTDTSLAESTTYYYSVYVYDGSGASIGSNEGSATTLVNEPPEAVVLAGVLIDETSIRLSWSTSNADDFESYRVYRDFAVMADTSDGTPIELINNRSQANFTDYAPLSDTTYHYRVFTFDKQGVYTGSNSISITK